MDNRIRQVERLWFLLLARGIVSGLVGLLLLSNPFADGRVIAGLFAFAAIVDGGLAAVSSRYLMRATGHGRELLIVGAIDTVTAVLAIVFPAVLSLRVIAGSRGIASGLVDALWARRLKSTELLALAAVTSVLTGMLLLAWPGPASTAIPWLIAFALIIPGGLFVAGALSEIRRLNETLDPTVV